MASKHILLILLLGAAYGQPVWTARLSSQTARWARMLMRRPWLGMLLVALLPMSIRLILLPVWPVPAPLISDEFSYLFAADTFASGRVANPPDPDWRFFETAHELSNPVRVSKYPPAQGLILAVAQVVTGEPWLGVWLSCGAMSAAFIWLMLGSLPRHWALAGGLLTGSYLSLSGYWMNSYWGGAVAATCGAVMLGAWTRLRRKPQPAMALIFGSSWMGLLASRPYEGALLLGLPLVLWAAPWRWPARSLIALSIPLGLGAIGQATYNQAIVGTPWRMPYLEHFQQYHYVPLFWFQPLRPKPEYRQEIFRKTLEDEERRYHTLRGANGLAEAVRFRSEEWSLTIRTLLPSTILIAPMILCLRRRLGLVALLAVGVAGTTLTTFHFAHYFAPFVPLFFLLLLTSYRSLCANPRTLPAATGLLVWHFALAAGAVYRGAWTPEPPNILADRVVLERMLTEGYEEHIVFVRNIELLGNAPGTWVHNRADLEHARVIWAADLGDTENQRLLNRFPGRLYWRIGVPRQPSRLVPYRARPAQQEIVVP